MKVAASETAAVLANGGKITDEQAKAFARLKVEASDAALALAKANIHNQIKFDKETAFLSSEDVQIAQKLAGIYPDVAEALGSMEAAAMRANLVMRQFSDLGKEATKGFISDIIAGKDALTPITSATTNLAARLARLAEEKKPEEQKPVKEAA